MFSSLVQRTEQAHPRKNWRALRLFGAWVNLSQIQPKNAVPRRAIISAPITAFLLLYCAEAWTTGVTAVGGTATVATTGFSTTVVFRLQLPVAAAFDTGVAALMDAVTNSEIALGEQII